MAWVERLPSGKYRAVYRDGAKRRRSAGTFTHKAEAKRVANEVEAGARKRLSSTARSTGPRTPWGQWADDWWPTRNVEASTLRSDAYRRTTHLDPRWAVVPIGAITRHDVRAWAAQMRRRGVGPSTVQRAVHLLSASLVAAIDAELIESNPAARLRLPKGAQETERYLTAAEVQALAEEMPTTDDQLVLSMLVTTGLRWGELAGMHAARFDPVRGVVRVVETFDEGAGRIKAYPKSRKPREVPLEPWIVDALLEVDRAGRTSCGVEHASGRCPGPLLLTTESGTVLRNSNWAPIWRAAVERSGIGHARIHDCRHTFASWVLQSKRATLVELQDLMGHASLQTTMRYAHLEPRDDGALRGIFQAVAPRLPHEAASEGGTVHASGQVSPALGR